MSLGLSITQLWEDPGVQQIYGLSHQFQLNETAKYGNHEYFNTKYIAWQSMTPILNSLINEYAGLAFLEKIPTYFFK